MKTNDLTKTAIFTSLTAIGAFISIPLGPIPLSLQTFFVLLAGLLLKPRQALMSQILYMVLGLVGLPIFAGFKGGPQQIFSPTFGFILGFILASYLVSLIFNSMDFSRLSLLVSCLLGSVVIYIIGLSYMYMVFNSILGQPMTFLQVFKLGCLSFLPGDLIKLLMAVIIGYRLVPLNQKNRLV